ncbi:MAG: sugar phosphate nucleotidyltransferase, partial [Ruthenibacterium sp.]
MQKIRKAVIPAAGLGTRVLPATKAMPKEMLPIVDKPAIQYIVEEAVAAGIEQILIITGRGKGIMEDHFDHAPELEAALLRSGAAKKSMLEDCLSIANLADVFFLRQKETLGLGHAILKARSFTGNEPFVVLYGDDVIMG